MSPGMARDIDPVEFGVRLRARREAREMSQTDLGEAVGMGQQGIAALEGGAVKRPRLIQEIADHLRTTKEWLWWGIPPEEAPPGNTEPPPETDITHVPLLDEVQAGRLARPSSQLPAEDIPLLAFADLGSGEFFALRVTGTSMDRVSPEGSVIVVNRKDKTLISGRYYVFGVGGKTTYKRWQGGDPPYLEPYSTDAIHKPMFVKRKKDFEVIGRVRRTVLDL